jgi:hypothetical protein
MKYFFLVLVVFSLINCNKRNEKIIIEENQIINDHEIEMKIE